MRHALRALIDPRATTRGARPKGALLRLDRNEIVVLVVLAAAALLFFAPIFFPLAAQATAREKEEEPRPARLWYGVTVGGAGTRLTCDLCQDSRDVAPAFAVSVGVHARARLRVGLEASRWTYDEDDVRERVHTVGLVAHLVPNASRGLYLLGGAGWTGYRAGEFSYDAPRLTVGLGWDVPFTGDWVVGNLVALDAAAFAPVRNGDVTVVRNVGMSTVRVAVQLQRR